MTPLGLLNFIILQWFGVRLGRTYVIVQRNLKLDHASIDDDWRLSVGYTCETENVPDGWRLVRWVWPLTGWWSPYRWIARRSS